MRKPIKPIIMKKTSTLQQKLKAYSAVAGAVAASAATADAQIIYTDVTPDMTVNTVGGSYNLDLNNDGTVEFVLGYSQIPLTFGTAPYTYTYNYNVILAQSPSPTTTQIDTAAVANFVFPEAEDHSANDPIGPTNPWFSGYGTNSVHFLAAASTLDPTSYNWGQWVGAVDKYLAIKFNIGANTHYGWARLDINSAANSFTIKDYAYESLPNTPILAGATPAVGIASLEAKGAKVFSFNKVINVNLGNVTDAVISVLDMTGREVSSIALAGGSTQIDLTSAAAGIYSVAINTAEGRSVTKVAIK